MPELKPFKADLSFIPTPAGTGQQKVFQTLAEKLSSFSGAAQQKYEEGVQDEASQSALEAVNRGEFSTIEEAGQFADQYNTIVRKGAASQLSIDLRSRIGELAVEHQNDPSAFKTSVDSHIKGMEKVITDPEMRFSMNQTAQSIYNPTFAKIKSNAVSRETKAATDAFATDLEQDINTILATAKSGDTGFDDQNQHAVSIMAKMQEAMEAGLLPEGFDVDAAVKSFGVQYTSAVAVGDVKRLLDRGDIEGAVELRRTYDQQNWSGVMSDEEKDSMLNSMDSAIKDENSMQSMERASQSRAATETRNMARNELFSGVRDGTATLENLDKAAEDGIISHSEWKGESAALTRVRTEALKTERIVTAIDSNITNGKPMHSSQIKNIDTYYEANRTDDPLANLDLGVRIAAGVGVIPTEVKNMLEVNSKNIADPEAMTVAVNYLDALRIEAPVVYAGLSNDVKAFGATVSAMTRGGADPEKVGQFAFKNTYQMSDQDRDQYDALSKDYLTKAATRDDLNEGLAGAFADKHDIGIADWDDPDMTAAVQASANMLFKEYMRSTGGNVEISKELAISDTINSPAFGVSRVTGKEKIMRKPPEQPGNYVPSTVTARYIPPNPNWVQEQLATDLKELNLDPADVTLIPIETGGITEYVISDQYGLPMVGSDNLPIRIQFSLDAYERPIVEKMEKEIEKIRQDKELSQQQKVEGEAELIRVQDWYAGE